MLTGEISIRKRGKKVKGETTERAMNNLGFLQYPKLDITKLEVCALSFLRSVEASNETVSIVKGITLTYKLKTENCHSITSSV